jgi:hypothetical protein
MPFILNDLPAYDQLLYEVLHESMDHLIDLGARCNAHSDVLGVDDEEADEDGGPSPIRVLRAQLSLDGAEDEVAEVQQTIQIMSQLLITRHSRRVIHKPQPNQTHE